MKKKSAIAEKYSPLLISFILTLFVGIIRGTCIALTNFGKSVLEMCNALVLKDSLSVLVTWEGIVFASLLTFLGLFMQMNNDTMRFIKADKNTYNRLLYFIKYPIFATGFSTVFSFILYITNSHISSWVLLIWGFLLVYSFSSTIRLISIYFDLVIEHTKQH